MLFFLKFLSNQISQYPPLLKLKFPKAYDSTHTHHTSNMASTNTNTTSCASCGKEGGNLNTCNKCNMVKYCNAACKKKHKSKHKKQCKKQVAKLHDEAVFKEPPPPEECPICLLPLPLNPRESMFQSCCGKLICFGCIYAMEKEARGRGKRGPLYCAFCRALPPTSEATFDSQSRKLMETDHAYAFYYVAGLYKNGEGVPQDMAKANELYLKAGELG